MSHTAPSPRMSWRKFLAACVTAVILSMALFGAAVYVSTQESRQVCVKVNLVQGEILGAVTRQKRSIESGTVTYYKTHPKEKAAALRDINKELMTFSPLKC